MNVQAEKLAMLIALCLANAAIAAAITSAALEWGFVKSWALAVAAQIVITGSLLLDQIYD